MIQEIRVTVVHTGVQVHFGQGHFDEFTIALAATRGIQTVVKSFADETPLFGTLALTVL